MVGGLCERCYAQGMYVPGVIVHHKIHLTPENVSNPLIALDPNNLELLCRDCHAAEHEVQLGRPKGVSGIKGRYYIDEDGKCVVDSSPLTQNKHNSDYRFVPCDGRTLGESNNWDDLAENEQR